MRRSVVVVWTLAACASGSAAERTAPVSVAAGERSPMRGPNDGKGREDGAETAPLPRGPLGRRSPGAPALALAIEAAKAGDLPLARQRCRGAIERDAQLEHAYLLGGSVCAMLGDPQCERGFYDDGLAALPRSAALLKERALLHLQQGEPAAAVAKYERANALTNGRSPETLADLAYAYVYVDRLDEARALADRATKLDERCFSCWMAAGQVSLSRRAFSEAVAAFARAGQLRPNDPDARRSEAKSRFLTGDLDRAAQLYEALITELPADLRLRVQAAQVAMKRGRPHDAVRHLSAAAKAHPDQPKLQSLLEQARRSVAEGKRPRAGPDSSEE